MKYVVIENSKDGIRHYGPFMLMNAAKNFVASGDVKEDVTYEICVIYHSRELTFAVNNAILNTQEGTS
jgi:hypothetical protein